MMPERDPLLQEREKTHGSFARNAEISQKLKELIHTYTMYRSPQFPHAQVEALDMICLKISRILSGKNDERDHWDDIAGYAKLASEACDK